MARLAYNLNFQRPSQLPLDSKRRILDDDDDSILDDSILDRTTPEMSVDGQMIRRESFADTSSNFSPRESGWSEFSYGGDPASVHKVPNASSHLFMERDGSAFMRAEVAHGAAYGNPSSAWHLQNASPGSGTPTTVFEGFPSDYEIKPAQPAYGSDALPVDHPNVYAGLPVRSGPIFPPSTALSASPQSGQDWISNSSSEQMELQAMPKHGPIDSPTYHPNPPLLRRDGIRKKNARFEIPAERTLRTIDHLINQTNDEQEIKELKQQKRLLRNRQAAYVVLGNPHRSSSCVTC